MSDGKVTISTALNNKGLESSLKKLSGVIVKAFSIGAIVSFAKNAINLGSDLEEVQNVVDVSFGAMASAAEEFASTAITQFGMSELAAKQTASTFMAMAKGMGIAESAASDMSISLAGLSGDVASFYNIAQEDAAKKLQGVFTGESEALKSLGVVMTQTNLKQFALENGMNANIEAMSQAELVALRYAFVTDALSLSSGDFVRTQDSWANQTRILSMQWQQFMGVIGQTLTTVLTPAIKLLNSLVGVLTSVAQKIQSVVASLFGKTITQTTAVADATSAGADGAEKLEKGITKAGKAAKKSMAGFDELNVLSDNSGGSGGAAGASATSITTEVSAGGVSDSVSPAIETITDKIKQLIKPLKNIDFSKLIESFTKLKDAISPFVKDLFSGLEWAWYNLLVPLAEWTIEDAIPAFVDTLSGCLDFLHTVLEGLKPFGEWLWNNFLQPIASWTGGVIVTVLEGIGNSLTNISDWVSENQVFIEDMVIVLGSVATAIGLVTLAMNLSSIAAGVWNAVCAIGTAVTTAFGAAMAFLTSPITLVVAAIAAVIAIIVLCIKHWDDIKAAAAACWDWIKGVWESVSTWFNEKVVQPVANFFSGLWDGFKNGAKKAWEGIKSVFSKVGTFFSDTFNAVKEKIVAVFQAGGKVFNNIKEGIVSVFKTVVNGIIKGLNTVIAAPFKGLNKILDTIHDISIAGVDPFKWLTWRAPVPQIPLLAQGAVLPANKPFLAMVGDQKHGTNIEAPLTTIQEALALVMQDYVTANLAGHEATVAVLREILEAVLGISIGDDVIANAVFRYQSRMAVVRGGQP